jgi:hypothetical protein
MSEDESDKAKRGDDPFAGVAPERLKFLFREGIRLAELDRQRREAMKRASRKPRRVKCAEKAE